MTNPKDELKQDLTNIITGLAETIRQCQEAKAIREETGKGERSPLIEGILSRYIVLDTCRLFAPEDESYPTRSIPAALNYIRFHADYLKIENRETVIKRLVAYGQDPKQFEGIPDPWITQLLRKEFADRLPKPGAPESSELSRALHTLESLCDKATLNPEDRTAIESAVNALHTYARGFVETMGKGYLNTDCVSAIEE
ncbi:MAG: hypothetical protein FJZ95_07210 [Chloroflexi bacterium]|nr:hypothetical protein [Chloroflexota bacterium]